MDRDIKGRFVKGHINPFKGIPRSEEIKRKISIANKGKGIGKRGPLGFIPKCAFKKGMIPWNKGKGTIKEKQYITLSDGTKALKINLTKGKFAIIDEEDFEKVNQYKWHTVIHDYAARKENKKSILMHRFILNVPINKEIDHINRNGLDNRKVNLRICSHIENSWNTDKKKNNKSGYKGVFFIKRLNLWIARISINQKSITLGYFKTKDEAAKMYNNYAKKYFGEFAYLNQN